MGKFLVLLILILVLYYMVKGLFRPRMDMRPPHRSQREVPGEVLVKDPCCETYVPMKSALQVRISGRDLFFCSRECMERYIKEKGAEVS